MKQRPQPEIRLRARAELTGTGGFGIRRRSCAGLLRTASVVPSSTRCEGQDGRAALRRTRPSWPNAAQVSTSTMFRNRETGEKS